MTAWHTETLDDGTPAPCDTLLHPLAAFIDTGGGLREPYEYPAQFRWEDEGRTLVLTDPALL
jgi:hypothetical protein